MLRYSVMGLVSMLAGLLAADKGDTAPAAKKASNKVAKKATKKAKRASGEKPATAIDRIGEASPLKGVAVPKHLGSKVGPSKKEGGFDGVKFGVKTGLRLTHFADAVLLANESSKATDAELNATLAAEFPKRVTEKSGMKGVPTIQTIAAYRAYFNAGKHGHNTRFGTDDERKLDSSSSYNAEGVARVASNDKPTPKKAKK
jgi:hypothetical protein